MWFVAESLSRQIFFKYFHFSVRVKGNQNCSLKQRHNMTREINQTEADGLAYYCLCRNS